MKKLFFCLVIVLILAFKGEGDLFFIPKYWPKPLYNFSNNPVNKQKVFLGRVLFYDPQLSKDNKISCASCHSQYSAFTHIDHALSHGIHDSIGHTQLPCPNEPSLAKFIYVGWCH